MYLREGFPIFIRPRLCVPFPAAATLATAVLLLVVVRVDDENFLPLPLVPSSGLLLGLREREIGELALSGGGGEGVKRGHGVAVPRDRER